MERAVYFVQERRHFKRKIIWMLIDALVIFACYTLAFFVRAITAMLEYQDSIVFILIATGLTVLTLYLFGIYHRIWAQTSGHGIATILAGVLVATVIVGILDVVAVFPRSLPLSVVLLGNAFIFGGLVATRYRSRVISGLTWRWHAVWHQKFPNRTNVLIVGAGETGHTLAWRIKHRWSNLNGNAYSIVGFVDDDTEKHGLQVEGCPVLGDRKDIPYLVQHYSVSLIVIALHNISGTDFRDILNYCESTDARIRIIPDDLEALTTNKKVPLLREIQPEDILGRKAISHHAAVDLSLVTGKRVLVTGAAGSIGSEIVRQIQQHYAPTALIALDNNESGLHDLKTMQLDDDTQHVQLDITLVDVTDLKATRKVFETYQPDVIFHAAAYKHVPMLEDFPYEAIRVNIGGTLNVARLAQDINAERFVLISTDKAVAPSSIMGASKRLCEILIHALVLQHTGQTLFTSVRFGNVLGSRGSVVPTFNQQIDRGGPLTVTHPEMARYFMTIPEAVNLVIHAACLTEGDDLFMLDMGEEIRIVELAERMIRLRGQLPYKDIDIEFTGVRPGEKLNEMLHHTIEATTATPHPQIFRLPWEHLPLNNQDFLGQIGTLLNTCSPECEHLAACLTAASTKQATENGVHPCLECLRDCLPNWSDEASPDKRFSSETSRTQLN